MRTTIRFCGIVVLALTVMTLNGVAGEAHYVNGVEGIKAATLPPPGLYGRLYGAYYNADDLTDDNGDKADLGFEVSVYALVPRVIWVSPYEILGGSYFADVIVPIIQTELSIDAANVDDDQFGLGDACVEPVGISWHGARYDAAVALGGYLPTGEYDKDNVASPGKDMWTFMSTVGGTVYADAEKTWSASILSRYEIHSEQEDENYTPGDDFHFEWGLAKTVNKTLDIGVAGYCRWQVTDDETDGVENSDKVSVMAAGPEISLFIPSQVLFVSARYLWEFEAKNTSEGAIGVITLTKPF